MSETIIKNYNTLFYTGTLGEEQKENTTVLHRLLLAKK